MGSFYLGFHFVILLICDLFFILLFDFIGFVFDLIGFAWFVGHYALLLLDFSLLKDLEGKSLI